MGVCVYGLKSSVKAFRYIYDYRTGKKEPMAEHYYLCHANDLDRYDRSKYSNLARARVAKAEKVWEGRISAMPKLSWYDKLEDGSYISAWLSVTEDDHTGLDGVGIARHIDCRDGSKEWVLMPLPKCRWCEDTGIVDHALTIHYKDEEGGGAYWAGGEQCVCVVGKEDAQERYRAMQEEADRAALAIRDTEQQWYSRDSSNL